MTSENPAITLPAAQVPNPLHRALLAASDDRLGKNISARQLLLLAHAAAQGASHLARPTTESLCRLLGVSRPTLGIAEDLLIRLGFIKELPDKNWELIFPFDLPQERVTAFAAWLGQKLQPAASHSVSAQQTSESVHSNPAGAPDPVIAPATAQVSEPPSSSADAGTLLMATAVPDAPVENVPAKPNSAATKPGDKTRKARLSDRMSDEEKAKILSDAAVMTRYLLWGCEFLDRDPEPGEAKPARGNWRVHNPTPEQPHAEKWTTSQFMAYYWFRVCNYRQAHQIKLTLPMWSRIGRDIETLLGTMEKPYAFRYISQVAGNWDAIVWMLGRAGSTLQLGEGTLTHGLVRNAVMTLETMTQPQIDSLYVAIREGQQFTGNFAQPQQAYVPSSNSNDDED